MRAASAVWLAGVVAGSLSSGSRDALSVVSAACLLALGIAAIALIAWAASKHRGLPIAQAGWLAVAAGLLIALVGYSDWGTLLPWLPSRLGRAHLWVTAGYLVAGAGSVLLAFSVGGANDRGRSVLWALGVSSGIFVVMVAALLAPGPGVPYSVGALDVRAVWRLLIHCVLMLLPMAFAVLAQLRSFEGHRARVWLWVAASSLVLAMGDVGAALFEQGGAQLYPRVLWALGTVFIAAAASLAADYELANSADGTEEVSEEAATPVQELLGRMHPTA